MPTPTLLTPTSIPASFTARAAERPRAVAVAAGTRRVTYRELDERSERLAHRLVALGVGPGTPCAVLMRRGPDLVVAVLAVLRSGGAFVPVHEAFPRARQEWILADAGAAVLLTDRDTRATDLPAGAPVVAADDPTPSAAAEPVSLPVVEADQTAYVMYTSGSTGHPKGVAVTHRAALGLLGDPCWADGDHQRVLMHAPHAFGVSNYEMLVPLLWGGTVVVAPPGDVTPAVLRSLVREHDLTAVHLTAGLMRLVAEEAPDAVAGVAQILTGGDVVPGHAVSALMAACPGTRVRVMYGSTESVLFTTTHLLRAGEVDHGATVPIGRPMAGLRVELLDERMRPVPAGVVAEIHVGGTRLARGYHRRPDLTAERFVADPTGPSGARLYRTGDLARRDADGVLEFVGRADDQIKVRGFREELGEVEHALRDHPDVHDAGAVARRDADGTARLVGYVVVDDPGAADPAALRAHVAATLPDFMVPDAVVALERLPLTPNGKLDRRALPAPTAAVTGGAGPCPGSATEAVVRRLFGEVLGVPEVGAEDDFFELGGHSLLAMRLITRLEDALGHAPTVLDLFDLATPAALAAALEQRHTDAAA